MAFSQLEFPNVGICKRSKRILDKNQKIFGSITDNISNIIQTFNNNGNVKEKLICFINLYELVNKNFEILSKYYTTRKFLSVSYEKKKEITSQVKNKIEEGEKVKLLYYKFLKISSIFERKYLDNIFENMKNKTDSTVNDCPICLDLIEKKEIVVTECNHCFHKKCLFRSLTNKKTCPICRSTI